MKQQLFKNVLCPNRSLTAWLIGLFLVILTAIVYSPIRHHDFINFDDNLYVTDNLHVRSGLTPDSIEWAFSVTKQDERAYWHPLTWLSHMLDCQIFGVNSGYHHLSNLVYHILNVLMLFIVFTRMTDEIWKSAFVAALFALHPLNVDSVAWIAERKNLLSTTFWFFTMLAYTYYARRPSLHRYLPVFAMMTAGLLAKPMLVTLPCVLFLMDFWPLNRIKLDSREFSEIPRFPRTPLFHLVAEKIPLLALAGISTALSVVSLRHHNQFISSDTISFWLRVKNAIVSYIQYILKIFWPHDLTIYYPFPAAIPAWQVFGASALMMAAFIFVFILARKKPFLTVGWLWYTGTLVPVIGIVQGGRWPAIADRWTYVPAIGLFIIASWGGAALLEKISQKITPKIILASLIILSLMIASNIQIKYWKNSTTLFSHAVAMTQNNDVAQYNLGKALSKSGAMDQAIRHYDAAIKINPKNEEAHVNLANALGQKGKLGNAIRHFNIALQLNPRMDNAYVGLGNVFAEKKRFKKAVENFIKALQINPDNAAASDNLGKIMLQQGNVADAFLYFKKTVSIEPDNENAKTYLKKLSIFQKKIDQQAAKISEAIELNPNNPMLYVQMGHLYQSAGYYNLAIPQYKKALLIKPDHTPAIYPLGITYALKGEYDRAIKTFTKVITNEPNNAAAYYNIACVYSQQNKKNEAIKWLEKSVDKGYDNLNNLKNDPDMDILKNEPAYLKLIHSISSKAMK